MERSYNCKDEELPVICRNALICMKRDLTDFIAFSPVFSEAYVADFEEKINLVDELVCPKIEVSELKQITRRLYETMDSLIDPIAKIRGYLLLAKKTIGVSAKDFGLALLSRKISDRNAEGTRLNLLLVVEYLEKYRVQLHAFGFSDSIIDQFNEAASSIMEDNQIQFNIINNRKAIVQMNMPVLNNLYTQLMDVLTVGKLLYKNVNNFKNKEYSFCTQRKNAKRFVVYDL
jgi:hypothetical protein